MPREGNQWIIALDDHRWPMVGTPDRRFLRFLAREDSRLPEVFSSRVAKTRCLGFDVERLVTP